MKEAPEAVWRAPTGIFKKLAEVVPGPAAEAAEQRLDSSTRTLKPPVLISAVYPPKKFHRHILTNNL
jgi:hypothetical protein